MSPEKAGETGEKTEVAVVKLGGSVITDKTKIRGLREETLKRLVDEIKEGFRERAKTGWKLVVVHGAGSFGHILAKEGKVYMGLIGAEDEEESRRRIEYMAKVQADVRRLNIHVLDAFNAADVPVFSIPPASIGVMRGGRIKSMDTGLFSSSMEMGLVPVSFGDVVLDTRNGFSICSGDQIILHLARMLPSHGFVVRDVVFVTDVDGIYTADPKKDPNARLIPVIGPDADLDKLAEGSKGTTDSGVVDVTGAMGGKLYESVEMAKAGARVFFLNGNAPGRLRDYLIGKKVVGTEMGPGETGVE